VRVKISHPHQGRHASILQACAKHQYIGGK